MRTSRRISHFCDTLEINFGGINNQISQVFFEISHTWKESKEKCFVKIFLPITLRLVSPWGRPGNPTYPVAQYTAYSPERPPYSPETAPTVSPAYPSFRQSIPMVPSVPSKHRLQDYKTALPANRKHNKNAQRRQIQRKA